jgi:hypothetical protein
MTSHDEARKQEQENQVENKPHNESKSVKSHHGNSKATHEAKRMSIDMTKTRGPE